MCHWKSFLFFFALLQSQLLVIASPEGSLALFDFRSEGLTEHVKGRDANVAMHKSGATTALRVTTGTEQPWPGAVFTSATACWDLTQYNYVDVAMRNLGSNTLTVHCRVDNPDADGSKNCVTDSIELKPASAGLLRVKLNRASGSRLDGKLFGMRGYPVAPGGAGTVNASKISQILLFVTKPSKPYTFDVEEIRAEGKYLAPTAWVTDADPFFPLIDTFGQYRHKDWPGKVHSVAELRECKDRESTELNTTPAPKGWDQYGGWSNGPKLKATGFFRVEKYSGKWWLVDPEGRLFWSHGIDCVRMMDLTPIEDRENWFADFPGTSAEFAEFIARGHSIKSHYTGRSPKCFSFAGANLLRKYGSDWRDVYPAFVHTRLRSWGLNTIGNWSDEGTRLLRRTPYVDAVSSGNARKLEGSDGYWGKFPDPFDASFRERLRASMQSKHGKSADDPWCVGYFSDNEMSWGDEMSLAEAALQSPPEQAAKREFIAHLKKRYGEIAKLNSAWQTTHASWEALMDSREAPDPKRAANDLIAFYTRIAEEYFRVVRDTIRQAAPNQLYLGCRFAWVNPRAAAAAAKYCDVVSYNLYRRSVADFSFNGGADVPLIIGEFHFGALDRGMFHTGLVPVASQTERAAAYTDYVNGALRHPQFVGCHWFQYMDQPTTGRVLDEENYQIGFVDTADTPYRETVDACRQLATRLYETRLQP